MGTIIGIWISFLAWEKPSPWNHHSKVHSKIHIQLHEARMSHGTGQGEDTTSARVHVHGSAQTLRLSQAMYVFQNSLVRNLKAAENSLCPHYIDRLFSLTHPIHSASWMHSAAPAQLLTWTSALISSTECFSPGCFNRSVKRRALNYSQNELIKRGK